SIAAAFGDGFQIGAGAKCSVVAAKRGHKGGIVGFEFAERVSQSLRGRAINGVADFGAAQYDGRDRPVLLYSDWHDRVSSGSVSRAASALTAARGADSPPESIICCSCVQRDR